MLQWIRMLLAAAAVACAAVPGIAAAGAGVGGHSDDDAAMLADAVRVVQANFATYNDKKKDPEGGTPSPRRTDSLW